MAGAAPLRPGHRDRPHRNPAALITPDGDRDRIALLGSRQGPDRNHLRARTQSVRHLRLNLPVDVTSSGTAMSPNVTQEPPSTVGGGIESAAAAPARLLPLIVMNEPGLIVRRAVGRIHDAARSVQSPAACSVPVGVSEITLSPESVMAYAVVPAESTAICRGCTLERVVPKTLATGFSGTTPASVSSPVCRLTISSVVRASSRVAVVMFCRTGVVSRRNACQS